MRFFFFFFFFADGIMITNNSYNNYVFLNVFMFRIMSMTLMNIIKLTERNFPPLRFSCLYGLNVSGSEIRYLPANHPRTLEALKIT